MGLGWHRSGTSVVPGWSNVAPIGTGATAIGRLTRRDGDRNWVRTLEMMMFWCRVLGFGAVTGPPAAHVAGCLEKVTHERAFAAHKMAEEDELSSRRSGAAPRALQLLLAPRLCQTLVLSALGAIGECADKRHDGCDDRSQALQAVSGRYQIHRA